MDRFLDFVKDSPFVSPLASPVGSRPTSRTEVRGTSLSPSSSSSLPTTLSNKKIPQLKVDGKILDEKEEMKKRIDRLQEKRGSLTVEVESVKDEAYIESDKQKIAEFDPKWFDENFDATREALENLPQDYGIEYLVKQKETEQVDLDAVTRSLQRAVLQHQSHFVDELNRVGDIQSQLTTAHDICQNGRSNLNIVKEGYLSNSVKVLATHRKKINLVETMKIISEIKRLASLDKEFDQFLKGGDYCAAITLCNETKESVLEFDGYDCMHDLAMKMKSVSAIISSDLNKALKQLCTNFDRQKWSKLIDAFSLTGPVDQITNEFSQFFEDKVEKVASDACEEFGKTVKEYDSKKWADQSFKLNCRFLCNSNVYVEALVNLCKRFCDHMNNFRRIGDAHLDIIKERNLPESNVEETETLILENRVRLWESIQDTFIILLLEDMLGHQYKFDEFLNVLEAVNTFADFGALFSGCRSDRLMKSLKQKSSSFFSAFHKAKIEDMKAMLEAEAWHTLPMQRNFSIYKLREFYFLKENEPQSGLANVRSVENLYEGYGNPFKGNFLAKDVENTDDAMDENDDYADVSAELLRDFVDEETGDTKTSIRRLTSSSTSLLDLDQSFEGPIVTATTLNVVRLSGTYIRIMQLLPDISFNVILGLTHLFDYYTYVVFTFFGVPLPPDFKRVNKAPNFQHSTFSRTFSKALSYVNNVVSFIESQKGPSMKVESTLNRLNTVVSGPPFRQILDGQADARSPTLSTGVNLQSENDLYGLANRITGTESLLFVAEVFLKHKPVVEKSLKEQNRKFFELFYSQSVNVIPELREYSYNNMVVRMIDFDSVLEEMGNVKWDFKEIRTEHNSYVDVIYGELNKFNQNFKRIGSLASRFVVRDAVWKSVIGSTMKMFIEGFSLARKCTNEGRAIMMLDFKQFLSKLENLVDVRPFPHADLVEEFIKAYYLQDKGFEQWVRANKAIYTIKQLTSLVNCGLDISRQSRVRLIQFLEDQSRF